MEDTQKDDRISVYELGYLLTGSVAEEKVAGEVEKVKGIITKAGATIIAEEMPHLDQLSYTMRVKNVSGSYEKYDKAYFGWIKFEAATNTVEAMKKAIEVLPTVLRMLLMTTVKENTYLGKRAASAIAASIMPGIQASGKRAEAVGVGAIAEDKKDAAPASIEEMDKSIDEMVKEV